MNILLKAYLLLFTALIFGCASPEGNTTDVENLGLKGDVKSIKISAFEAVERFGEVESTIRMKTYITLRLRL